MNRRIALSGTQLKLLALLSMTIDHTAATLVRSDLAWYQPLRNAGRLAFPIYCFLLAEGYVHTKDLKRYLGRLLFAAALSELPFELSLYRKVPAQRCNVMLTLALGLVTVLVLDRLRGALWKLAPYLGRETAPGAAPPLWMELPLCFAVISGGMGAAFWLKTDYRGGGVLLIVLFFLFRDRMDALLLLVPPLLLVFYNANELWGALALLPIALYDPQKDRPGPEAQQKPDGRRKAVQWFFYLYYPLHLSVLCLLREAIHHTPLSFSLPF